MTCRCSFTKVGEGVRPIAQGPQIPNSSVLPQSGMPLCRRRESGERSSEVVWIGDRILGPTGHVAPVVDCGRQTEESSECSKVDDLTILLPHASRANSGPKTGSMRPFWEAPAIDPRSY